LIGPGRKQCCNVCVHTTWVAEISDIFVCVLYGRVFLDGQSGRALTRGPEAEHGKDAKDEKRAVLSKIEACSFCFFTDFAQGV
jgi:hypothetical protein